MLEELRDPQLPRSVRGYEEEATRRLLELAAGVLDRLVRERDRLLAGAAEAPQDDPDQPNAETIGQALATATALGERIVAEAKERADVLRAEAEAEAAGWLETARRDADAQLVQKRAEIARLEREAEVLSASLEAEKDAFVATARAALERLDELQAATTATTAAAAHTQPTEADATPA
jgi:cell division septum initiation protein DivIVA